MKTESRFGPKCKACGGTGFVLVETRFRSRFTGELMMMGSWGTCGKCQGFGFLPQ